MMHLPARILLPAIVPLLLAVTAGLTTAAPDPQSTAPQCTPCAHATETPVGAAAAPDATGAVETAPPSGSGAASATSGPLPLPYLIGGGVLLLALAGVLLWFTVFTPMRKRGLLKQAQSALARGDAESLATAEAQLGNALTAGMSKQDVNEARFELAYVRARRKQYAEASAVLSELIAEGNPDKETLYLQLWLQFKQDKFEAVDKIVDQHAQSLAGLLDASLMAGIAYLRLAHQCWGRGDIEQALNYYRKVRKINHPELKDRIPQQVDAHQMVLGIRALLNHQAEEARRQFTAAGEEAAAAGRTTIYSRLGLLVCDWHERPETIEAALAETVAEMRKVAEAATKPTKASAAKEPSLTEEQRLLRNVLLWQAAALVAGWVNLPQHKGLPKGEQSRLDERLQAVREIDPEMPDVELLAGLIAYYFAGQSNQDREAAVTTLGKFRELGGNLPDALSLLEREERLAEEYSKTIDRFLSIVRQYAEDPKVDAELRKELLARLQRYSRFKQLSDIEVRQDIVAVHPSVEDLRDHGELLRSRVDRLIKPRLKDAAPEERAAVENSVHQLDDLAKTLAEKSDQLKKAEVGLLATAGELLLKEEPQSDPWPSVDSSRRNVVQAEE